MNKCEKTKLTTTLKLLKEKEACAEGCEMLINYLGHDYDENAEINLLTILKSNGIDHFFRAFMATQQDKELTWKTRNHIAADIAESVLYLYEREFTDDKRPRLAIEACRNDAAVSDASAYAAAYAAYAASAASAAAYAASVAAYAAAAYAAAAAAYAAYASVAASAAASVAAAYAAADADDAAAAAYAAADADADDAAMKKEREKQIEIIHSYLEENP